MNIVQVCQKSPNKYLSEAETRKILRDVVRGLTYHHSSNIIHHDIKLENFIIGSKGRVKIADFGFATLLKNDDEKQFTVAGTTNYLSPEIIRREGHSYEADIWATGVAAFTMLTKVKTYEKILDCNYEFPSNIILSEEAEDFINSIFQINSLWAVEHTKSSQINVEQHLERFCISTAIRKKKKLNIQKVKLSKSAKLSQETDITKLSHEIERSKSSQSSTKIESKPSQKVEHTKTIKSIHKEHSRKTKGSQNAEKNKANNKDRSMKYTQKVGKSKSNLNNEIRSTQLMPL